MPDAFPTVTGWWLLSLRRGFSSARQLFLIALIAGILITALGVPIVLVSSAVAAQQAEAGSQLNTLKVDVPGRCHRVVATVLVRGGSVASGVDGDGSGGDLEGVAGGLFVSADRWADWSGVFRWCWEGCSSWRPRRVSPGHR